MDPVNPDLFHNDQFAASTLPDAEEVSYEKLSLKLLYKKFFSTGLTLCIFLFGSWLIYYFYPEIFKGYFPIAQALIFIIFFWNFMTIWQWQKRSGYAIREKDVLFKRGFLSEKITAVPFNRIQHVTTQRGVLDKMLGISTLKIFTAGGSGSDISIPGLTPSLAASLKDTLSDSISKHV